MKSLTLGPSSSRSSDSSSECLRFPVSRSADPSMSHYPSPKPQAPRRLHDITYLRPIQKPFESETSALLYSRCPGVTVTPPKHLHKALFVSFLHSQPFFLTMPLFYLQGMPIGGVSLMLACVASIGGFIFGYDTGQISDILVMDDFRQRFGNCTNPSDPSTCEFTNVRAGLIVSLLSIGTLSGALAGAVIADFLGRRWAMISECLLFCVGLIIQMTTFTVWQQVAVGRFVAGLAIGALSAAVPMYQAETAPTQLRGTLTATYQLFITAGILAAYSIGIGTRDLTGAAQWKTLIGIGFAWPALLIFGMLFMPESPRWLAAKGRSKEAARAIARTYGIPQKEADSNRFVQAEVDEIINQLEAERRLKAGWIDCFRTNNMTLYRTILGMSLQSLQQLTGANYFFYYGATIFRGVGIADSFVSQIILGAVNFGCTFGGLYVMERFGRRLPLIWGGLWQALWLFVFAAAGTARDPLYNESVGKREFMPLSPSRMFTRAHSYDHERLSFHSRIRDDLGSRYLDFDW
ncbi:sugar transporter, variant 2 [Coprinopsis cinerea AmutBmut pab1-1]|nr:sugar transporter, variant 2 [Coprinopsis cinerea AmutBmut pab1-1]